MVGSFALFSCNQTTEETKENKAETVQIPTTKTTEGLQLNNGEKWVVNEEIKPHVMEGENLINVYAEINQADFKKLAADVKMHNDKLIKSCTMDGKSHDELHKWLAPHLQLTKALSEETDVTKANDIVKKLQNSYITYHQYFN